jgi:hypothetical protein
VNSARCLPFQAMPYPYADPFYGSAMTAYGSHAIVSDIYAIHPVLSLISSILCSSLNYFCCA